VTINQEKEDEFEEISEIGEKEIDETEKK